MYKSTVHFISPCPSSLLPWMVPFRNRVRALWRPLNISKFQEMTKYYLINSIFFSAASTSDAIDGPWLHWVRWCPKLITAFRLHPNCLCWCSSGRGSIRNQPQPFPWWYKNWLRNSLPMRALNLVPCRVCCCCKGSTHLCVLQGEMRLDNLYFSMPV